MTGRRTASVVFFHDGQDKKKKKIRIKYEII